MDRVKTFLYMNVNIFFSLVEMLGVCLGNVGLLLKKC